MRYLPFILTLMLPCTAAIAQGPPRSVETSAESCVRIWHGFSQTWGYNHRIHRLGDYVLPIEGNPCAFRSVHGAASGSGSDSARFTQHYVDLEAPGVGFYPQRHTLHLEGKEGQMLRAELEGELFHPELADPNAAAAVVLNGFDLHSAAGVSPDKPIEFLLAIDTFWTNPEKQSLHFRLQAGIRFACTSPECGLLDNAVHYQLDVHSLCIVGGDFIHSPGTLFQSQAWKRDSLPYLAPQLELLSINPNMAVQVPAITRLQFQLSDEFHMLGWQSWILPSPIAARGLLPLNYGLNFQQWAPAMFDAYRAHYEGLPKLPATCAVKRKSGSSVMEIGLLTLQFRSGEATLGKWEGGLFWETRHGKHTAAKDAQGEKSSVE